MYTKVEGAAGRGGERVGYPLSGMAVVVKEHRPSHPCNAGTEHVEFSPTRQAFLASPPGTARTVSGAAEGGGCLWVIPNERKITIGDIL